MQIHLEQLKLFSVFGFKLRKKVALTYDGTAVESLPLPSPSRQKPAQSYYMLLHGPWKSHIVVRNVSISTFNV